MKQKKKTEPSRKSKKINANAWWYEDKHGLHVVHQIFHAGAHIRTDTLRLHWSKLLKAASRCGRIKPARR